MRGAVDPASHDDASQPLDADVLVVGSGPAGSTAATLLAREGRRVLMVDREALPRYHIGESLLPGVLPLLEELGVRREVEALGFTRKTGQTFVWGRDRTPWQLDFSELDAYPYSLFVERADFDALLARNAVRAGATLLERHAVTAFAFDAAGRVTGASLRGPERGDGRPPATREVRARYTLDASGQAALLARHFGLRRFQRGLRGLAIWSYFEGAGRLAPPAHEHIITVSVPDGWAWFIPMRHGRTSVGVVTSHTAFARRTGRDEAGALEDFYARTLADCAPITGLLASARRVEPLRAQRDWSYRAARFAGPGYLLAGDAACFVDPILSTGVNLAMNGGYLAALALHSALAEPAHEPAFVRYFQRAYRTLFDEMLAQVKHFYRVEAQRASVFWNAKQLLRADPRLDGALAFLFVNSGLARHVTSARPHDVPAQARAAFASRVAPRESTSAASPDARAAAEAQWAPGPHSRPLVRPGELVIVQGGDRRLYGVTQRGMRLSLEPATPRGYAGRPAGSAALFELEARPSGEPLGTLLIEPLRPDLDPRVRTARGFAVSSRAYGPPAVNARAGNAGAAAVMAEATAEVLRWVEAGSETSLRPLARRVRQMLRAQASGEGRGGAAGWALARRPALERGALPEPPVCAEIAWGDPARGASVWLVARARRPPEIVEDPLARTRFVDLEYRMAGADEARGAPLDALLAWGASAVRRATSGRDRLAGAMRAVQSVFAQGEALPAGWSLLAVRRVETE